jgi:hypothetical protein
MRKLRFAGMHTSSTNELTLMVWEEFRLKFYVLTGNTGEDYLAYNERRWGGDGWTYSLRRKGKEYGLGFAVSEYPRNVYCFN